jgi:hypothetical protein
LVTEPPSRSAWVTVCKPEHSVETPGFNEVETQVTPAVFRSVIAIAVIVTLPVFATVNEYGIVAFSVEKDVSVLAFVIVSSGVCTAGTTIWLESTGVVVVPFGNLAVTDAMFFTEPALRSAAVTILVPEHDVDCPGASAVDTQVTPVVFVSVTAMLVNVRLPSFLTTNVYGIVSPTAE